MHYGNEGSRLLVFLGPSWPHPSCSSLSRPESGARVVRKCGFRFGRNPVSSGTFAQVEQALVQVDVFSARLHQNFPRSRSGHRPAPARLPLDSLWAPGRYDPQIVPNTSTHSICSSGIPLRHGRSGFGLANIGADCTNSRTDQRLEHPFWSELVFLHRSGLRAAFGRFPDRLLEGAQESSPLDRPQHTLAFAVFCPSASPWYHPLRCVGRLYYVLWTPQPAPAQSRTTSLVDVFFDKAERRRA